MGYFPNTKFIIPILNTCILIHVHLLLEIKKDHDSLYVLDENNSLESSHHEKQSVGNFGAIYTHRQLHGTRRHGSRSLCEFSLCIIV